MNNNREKICLLYDKYHTFLTPSQRQAIFLYYFEDFSLREIADHIASSRSAVQNALKAGIVKLEKIEQNLKNI